MNNIGLIPDIPKLYTAIAEWLGCLLYIFVNKKKFCFSVRDVLIAIVSLVLLGLTQSIIGIIPVALWIPGMLVAVGIMFVMLRLLLQQPEISDGYWLVRAFVLAEMAASLEWQLYYFVSVRLGADSAIFRHLFMLIFYAAIFTAIYLVEKRQELLIQQVSVRELITTATIGIVCFLLSNLSYVWADTPFSSSIATEAFNIRTLIDLGGYAFLLAYHIQLIESGVKSELSSIQNILRNQYMQYRQSQESIDIINHKYHDLKHQINVLRQETNPEKKAEYLDAMEQEIKDYESMFKTGNGVLDTLLTSTSLKCARRDITFTCVADGTLLNNIYVMDICTIFGNALDNAIEYEVQIEDREKRLIHVSVSKMNEFVLIRIENYLQEELQINGELPRSTKGDQHYHGFGLKSIKYSVEKYNGTLSVKAEDSWFVLNILIPKGE